MKTFRLFSMAALALAMAACSNEDSALENPTPAQPGTMHFTATLAAPGSGATTRTTYTEITSGVDAGKINVAWKAGDQIFLYDLDNGAECTATVGTPVADGSATISGTFDYDVEAGENITATYPASAANDDFINAKFASQAGTIAYIQDNLDYRKGTSTISVEGTEATLATALQMESQIAIWKLTLQDNAATPAALSATKVTIKNGSTVIAATTDISATSAVYLALNLKSGNISGADITIEATVGSDTYTYSKSGVSLAKGNYYQSTVTMAKQASVPTGALSGEFSVSATKKVYFSKGNLQYDGTNWKFADSQWEVLGVNGTGANGTATGYPMDLFTWGNIDSPAYDGYPYVTGSANLSGDTDWGIRMGSGWRTLSGTAEGEWFYLFNTRMVNGGYGAGYSYTLGQSVNGKLGVVIYPDDYAGDLYTTGANWSTFEAAGCVFLPAAGYRNGASVSDVGDYGGYWSSTANSEYSAWMVDFDNMGNWNANNAGASYYGHSVRLVYDVAAPAPANKLLSAATAEDIGKVVGADGKIYANVAAAQAASTTACAIIAYVGSATGEASPYNHGMAIAMKDASAGYLQWKTSKGSNDNTNQYTEPAPAIAAKESGSALSSGRNNSTWPAFAAALANSIDVTDGISAAAPTSGTSGWFLPSFYQWNMIVKGLSGQSADLSWDPNDNYNASSLNTKIEAAGGTGLLSFGYWSSTEYDGDYALSFGAGFGSVNADTKSGYNNVRSAFAF